MKLAGSEILIRSLLAEGVSTLFGYPGGQVIPVFDTLYDYRHELHHVLTRHEQGAVHAAQGYARASGGVGVCLVTSGPGATNVITGVGDAMLDIYSDATDNRSPFYGSYYALGTGNHVAAYPIISYMQFTNDPRIAYAFNVTVKSGEYMGQFPGAKADMKTWGLGANDDWKNNDVSAVNYSLYNGTGASRPAYLYTQAALQFLIAEAKMRFMNDEAGAKAAYEAAITADFEARGMAGQEVDFLSGANVNWDNAADKLHLIYMQRWATLFYMDNMEAWSEMRRTDVPELSAANGYDISQNTSIYTPGDLIEPYRNGLEAGGLLKRMFYPQSARNLNPNTPPMKTGSEPVWWDVN